MVYKLVFCPLFLLLYMVAFVNFIY